MCKPGSHHYQGSCPIIPGHKIRKQVLTPDEIAGQRNQQDVYDHFFPMIVRQGSDPAVYIYKSEQNRMQHKERHHNKWSAGYNSSKRGKEVYKKKQQINISDIQQRPDIKIICSAEHVASNRHNV